MPTGFLSDAERERLISRLQSYRRQNALTRALQEYGRLVKTIFILRYLMTVAAHNLGRVLRKLFGVGKPRALQGDWGLCARLETVVSTMLWLLMTIGMPARRLNVAMLRSAG